MHFLIDNKFKVIFAFSAKCGCSSVKKIFLENTSNTELIDLYKFNKTMHFNETCNKLPDNFENFYIIIFIRNPYKRLVSGFFNKYLIGGEYRSTWKKNEPINFENFVNTICHEGLGNNIERHHFTPQTSEKWEDRLIEHKNLTFMKISDIDYSLLNTIFKTDKIKEIHYNNTNITEYNSIENAWNIQIDELFSMSPDYSCLYNKELKEKVYNFYKKDFEVFKKFGFDFDI